MIDLSTTVLANVPYIWLDGAFVPSDSAVIHTLAHGLHYGFGVFEGIRSYQTDAGSAVFKLREHMRRLHDSAKMLHMAMPFDVDALCAATVETLQKNNLPDAYIRPLAFSGLGAMGLAASNNPTRIMIAAWKWGTYLGEEGLTKGIRLKVSSYSRHHVNSNLTKAKASGHYIGSILAKREAIDAGYDEALMLDTRGYVSECSGENIFIVRDGRVSTPPLSAGILDGITRATIQSLAAEAGIEVVERDITREELYTADEVFLTGTAAEITPVHTIDGRSIGAGARGPVTEKLQAMYFDAVQGRDSHAEWRTSYRV